MTKKVDCTACINQQYPLLKTQAFNNQLVRLAIMAKALKRSKKHVNFRLCIIINYLRILVSQS